MSQVLGHEPVSPVLANRELLHRNSVLAVCLIGGPGNGKTELLSITARRLQGELAVGAIIANPTANRDAQRVKDLCTTRAVEATELSPGDLWHTLKTLDLNHLDLLLIEHQAPDRPGSSEDLGQDAVVAMFSVADGDDKAAEFPHHIAHSDLVILSKADLLPHVRFNGEIFRRDVNRANPYVHILELSATGQAGVEEWLRWLRCRLDEKCGAARSVGSDVHPEWYFG